MQPTGRERPRLGVVGVCGSGKSTLVKGLAGHGIECRHIAQEHSYVPAMWQKISNPAALVFLEVSYPVTMRRRRLNWTMAEYEEQLRRLQHARQHADLIIHTDDLSAEQVLQVVLTFLNLT